MPTIKTKKEMNLPELIEWGIKNGITSKEYTCNEREYKSVIFSTTGAVHLNRFQAYLADDKFEVEIEEPITEDTVIPEMLTIYNEGITDLTNNKSLNDLIKNNLKSAYIMNDDLRLILIWRDGKLVE